MLVAPNIPVLAVYAEFLAQSVYQVVGKWFAHLNPLITSFYPHTAGVRIERTHHSPAPPATVAASWARPAAGSYFQRPKRHYNQRDRKRRRPLRTGSETMLDSWDNLL